MYKEEMLLTTQKVTRRKIHQISVLLSYFGPGVNKKSINLRYESYNKERLMFETCVPKEFTSWS